MTPPRHKKKDHRWQWQDTSHADGYRITSYTCACGKVRVKREKMKKRTQKPHNRVSRVRYIKPPKKTKDAPQGSRIRKTRLKPVSDKRSAENRKYLKIRRQFLQDNPYCQVCRHNFSNQVHHQRGKEGPWLTDVSEFLACCGTCHSRIEENREWAAEQGYLKLRLTTDQLQNHD